MTVGLIAAQANAVLNLFRATNITAPAGVYLRVHIGDPGAAGTANSSAVTTRNAITFAAPSAGSMALTTVGAFSMTATETISHVSIWDAATGGTCLQTAALTSTVAVVNGSSLTFSALTASYTPIAA